MQPLQPRTRLPTAGLDCSLVLRQATSAESLDIAKLATIAGDGVIDHHWHRLAGHHESFLDVGRRYAASRHGTFSYTNAHLALRNGHITGMLLGAPISRRDTDCRVEARYPAFIQPMLELERRLAVGSFYVNLLAVYPAFRRQGIGQRLLALAETVACMQHCRRIGIQVFERNRTALHLYRRCGFHIVDRVRVIAHPCLAYQNGHLLLLTKRPRPVLY